MSFSLLSIISIFFADVCITEEGKQKCQTIRNRMFKALERLLCRRLSHSQVHKVISEVHSIIEMFRDDRNSFNAEWDQMFVQNLHIKWPNFVWDLFTTPLPQREDTVNGWIIVADWMKRMKTWLFRIFQGLIIVNCYAYCTCTYMHNVYLLLLNFQ